MSQAAHHKKNKRRHRRPPDLRPKRSDPEMEPDWSGKCSVCDESPTVPFSGMCGPCTFGEASTLGGNW